MAEEIKTTSSVIQNMFKNMQITVEDEAVIDQFESEQQAQKNEAAFAKSGIAEKFKTTDIADIISVGLPEMNDNKGHALTMDIIDRFIADVANGKPRVLFFFGEPGTGKSTMAIAIMHELCKKSVSCAYFKSHEIMQRLDDVKWRCSKETRAGIVQEVCTPTFRIFDEIGRYPDSKGEQFVLFDMTNRIYETFGSGIYITNLPKSETSEFLGKAVIDRCRGIGMTIEFNGKTLRGTEKELYTK